MEYVRQGHSNYPMTLGHEWCGTVSSVGPRVDETWLGRRVTGDTMLGCGSCSRCRAGRHHVCADRSEIGIRGSYPGALAERLRVPAVALHALPDTVDDSAGAMVEPGGNALRSFEAAGVAAGERLLVIGPGTIGLLVAEFAAAAGVEVPSSATPRPVLDSPGASGSGPCPRWTTCPTSRSTASSTRPTPRRCPRSPYASSSPERRVVYVGLSGTPGLVDSRDIALKDVTAVGILGASAGLAGTIESYASGAVDPDRLVAAVVGLDQVHDALAGARPAHATPAPKIHVDPRLTP